MAALPHLVKDIDLLRWVKAHPNVAFDPTRVVSLSTGHSTDWEWQAVEMAMDLLKSQSFIALVKREPDGTTYWKITTQGERRLRALERAEETDTVPDIVVMDDSTDSDLSPPEKLQPPMLDLTFASPSVALNETTKLTFNITNPNQETQLMGISFVCNLPAGLVIAQPNDLVGSWDGDLNARAGTRIISLSNAHLGPQKFLSFQFNVGAVRVGTYVVTTTLTSDSGVGPPASASINVVPALLNSDVARRPPQDWFDQRSIGRFSEGLKRILISADRIRASRKKDAVSTIHLLMAFAEQPSGQLSELLKEASVDLTSFFPPDDLYDGPLEPDIASGETWKFPRITRDVRVALSKAVAAADAAGSLMVEENHLAAGLLSLASDNLLIEGLNQRGITADRIKLAPPRQIGPSTHVARDRWTVDDSLGYFPYAYAIYRFLTDKGTQPPLAISIQAPWGGGKTSLMRMVQRQLDPESAKKLDELKFPEEPAATVQDVMKELDRAAKKTPSAKVAPIDESAETRVTVWFNAWKYESTSQVWSGLADAIVKQVSERLPAKDRELFWFRLQLRRLDSSKVRQRIYEEVFSRFIQKLLPRLWKYFLALAAAALTISVEWLPVPDAWKYAGPIGGALVFLGTVWSAGSSWAATQSAVEAEPANITLGEFVTVPDYEANLGFIHHVVDDLKRALELIPERDRPVVIFVDDLDRCSPSKVADVIEAINLFLAGEFPYCMFVLGIDDEMVAAALDQAHKDVIARLPAYAKSASIGWRFMDKFVQLPFIVPPPIAADRAKYTESLLHQGDPSVKIELKTAAVRALERKGRRSVDEIADEVSGKAALTPKQRAEFTQQVQAIDKMDQNISSFSDAEEQVRNLIVDATKKFSINPRDVKRFVNVFRFYYFLRAAREARNEPVPSMTQLTRWITLSLKWPEIVRWLRRGHLAAAEPPVSQLRKLEEIAKSSAEPSFWKEKAAKVFGFGADSGGWLQDQELLEFFHQESEMGEGDRLSASADKGLW